MNCILCLPFHTFPAAGPKRHPSVIIPGCTMFTLIIKLQLGMQWGGGGGASGGQITERRRRTTIDLWQTYIVNE